MCNVKSHRNVSKLPGNADVESRVTSWVPKKGVLQELKIPGKIRPTTYSDRLMKRFFDFPDSPINDVVLNFFMGKCVYDHCFPYHTHYQSDYREFNKKLSALSEYLCRNVTEESNDVFLDGLSKCGMLGILTKTEVNGMGLDQRRELLRLSETMIDYTHDLTLIRKFLMINCLQLSISKCIPNAEIADNLQKLINEGVKTNFLVFKEAQIDKREGHWIVSTSRALPFSSLDHGIETSGLLFCLIKDPSDGAQHVLIVPTTEKEGVEFGDHLSEVNLRDCTISSSLVISGGDEFLKNFQTMYRLTQGAIVAAWFKKVANQIILETSRRRRFGYRMNKFQNVIIQVEEIEQLCYVMETLPYFSASRMDRAVNHFNQELSEMHAEVCSAHLQLARMCRQINQKLLTLSGPNLMHNPSFVALSDFVDNYAFNDVHSCEQLIVEEGMKLYRQSLTDKSLQRPLRLRLRQLKFNYLHGITNKQVETGMSDWLMLFVHQNFQHIANDFDKQVFALLRLLGESRKAYRENYYKNPNVTAIVKETVLNLHAMVAVMARASQSIFKGNRYSLHENRMAEKYLSDMVCRNVANNKRWIRNAPFEVSAKTAKQFQDDHDIFNWIKYSLN